MQFNPLLDVVRQPIEMVGIAGAGGLQFNSIVECYGDPKSGKTSYCYQTAGLYFLPDYGPRAELLILDVEQSANLLRLQHVFNIRPGWRENDKGRLEEIKGGDARVYLCHAQTIEGCCMMIINHMRKAIAANKFLMVIWDSLTASVPAAEYEELQEALKKDRSVDPYVAGQMLRPRIIRKELNNVLGEMWYSPVLIMLINQVSMKPTQYGAVAYSAGGMGKQHNAHYVFYFNFKEKLFENKDEKHLVVGTLTHVTIEKSKNTPRIDKIPVFIRDTMGGIVEPGEELVAMARDLGFFEESKKGDGSGSGWYNFGAVMKKYLPEGTKLTDTKFQLSQLKNNVDIHEPIRVAITKLYRERYMLVDLHYAAIEEAKLMASKK